MSYSWTPAGGGGVASVDLPPPMENKITLIANPLNILNCCFNMQNATLVGSQTINKSYICKIFIVLLTMTNYYVCEIGLHTN